jgi:hypothetical protein
MDAIWIECLHNLHCPRCERRLVQRAGRHFHSRLQQPVYVGKANSLACPLGHRLPERQELYAYRAARGHAVTAPVSEVVPPGC